MKCCELLKKINQDIVKFLKKKISRVVIMLKKEIFIIELWHPDRCSETSSMTQPTLSTLQKRNSNLSWLKYVIRGYGALLT